MGPGFGALPRIGDYKLDPPDCDGSHHEECPAYKDQDSIRCDCKELDKRDMDSRREDKWDDERKYGE